ncbi:MAG: PilZ domain-containing protein [Spirochaetota bacterium]
MSKSSDKRKFERYSCKIKTKFDYYEGDPETIDIYIDIPGKAKGTIIDISKGGLFILSNERTSVGIPIVLHFEIKKTKFDILGNIVRTGSLKNNPSELAKKFLPFLSSGNNYIAVEFNDVFEQLNPELL